MTIPASPCLSVLVSDERAQDTAERLVDLGATAMEERDATTMTGAGGAGATCLIAGVDEAAAGDRAATVV